MPCTWAGTMCNDRPAAIIPGPGAGHLPGGGACLARSYAWCNDPGPAAIPPPRCSRSHLETGYTSRCLHVPGGSRGSGERSGCGAGRGGGAVPVATWKGSPRSRASGDEPDMWASGDVRWCHPRMGNGQPSLSGRPRLRDLGKQSAPGGALSFQDPPPPPRGRCGISAGCGCHAWCGAAIVDWAVSAVEVSPARDRSADGGARAIPRTGEAPVAAHRS